MQKAGVSRPFSWVHTPPERSLLAYADSRATPIMEAGMTASMTTVATVVNISA